MAMFAARSLKLPETFPISNLNRRLRTVPLFSVILPTFNREYCIEAAIRSVQAQTLRSWELLVVDDGSRDRTADVVRALAREDDRIRLFTQANRGPAVARNTAIHRARAEYLAFIDSDDSYSPHHLAYRYRALKLDPLIDFLHGGMEIAGSPWVPDRDKPGALINLEESGIPVTGTFVVRTEAALKLGGFPDVRYSEDGLFLEAAIKSGMRVRRFAGRTYRYNRESIDSICTVLASKHTGR